MILALIGAVVVLGVATIVVTFALLIYADYRKMKVPEDDGLDVYHQGNTMLGITPARCIKHPGHTPFRDCPHSCYLEGNIEVSGSTVVVKKPKLFS